MLWGGQAHGTKASSIPGNKALLAPRVHKEKGPGWGLSRPALGFLRVETACHPPPRPGSERSGRHVVVFGPPLALCTLTLCSSETSLWDIAPDFQTPPRALPSFHSHRTVSEV